MAIDFDATDSDSLEFEIWLKNGYDRGWVSDVFCNTHDGAPMDDLEMQQWDDGEDPCSFQVRIWQYS
jgi:hypothetical protein